MGRYGVTIKNPDFSGITYDSRYTEEEVKDELTYYKAQLCAAIISYDSKNPLNCSMTKMYVNLVIEMLKQQSILQYKSWMEEDELYLDDVKYGSNEYQIEGELDTYNDIIRDYKQELMMYVFADINKVINCDDKSHLIEEVRVQINKLINDMFESILTWVALKIAYNNFSKIVKEEKNPESDD